MHVSSAAILFLCYFAIFLHDPVPNDSNELCVVPHSVTAEASVVHFIDFHPTKTHLEGGNHYANKLLLSNCLHIVVI